MTDTPEIPSTPSDSTPPTPPVPPSELAAAEVAPPTVPTPPAPVNPAPVASVPTPPVPLSQQPAATAPTPPVAPSEQVTTELPAPAASVPPTFPPAESVAIGAAPSRKRSTTVGIVAAIAVAAIVGGAAGAGATLLATSNDRSNGTQSSALDPTAINVNDPDDATTVTAVAAKATPSVVTISVSADSAGGTGSGVILSADGYILTNTHVVTLDGASADGVVKVTFSDGRIMDATVVGTDPVSDLAVIKVDATGLTPATFADSSKLNVGDTAIAIGAPLGLSGTVTDGIVSALNRSITIASSAVPDDQSTDQGNTDGSNPFDLWGFDLPGQSTTTTSSSTISIAVIQTDAAINPGNSGGALLNSEAEVIGINVAIASAGSTTSGSQSGSIGVGFAIPANLAKRVSDEIIKNGTATHGLLGASIVNDTSTSATDKSIVGAEVSDVTSGGAAEAAGLKAGDIITSFNGLPVTDYTDLIAQVRALAAGASAPIGYSRNGDSQTATVTLGKLE